MLNLHHDNDVKVVVSSQSSIMWYKLANQKIRILTVYESWIVIINNNYIMSPSWIWSDKITNEPVERVGYNHFISNKGEWNNCFSKFSNRVLPPIFISTILQIETSGKSIQLPVTLPSHLPRLPLSPDYYITKSWMKVTATQTTICRQLVAKTKLKLFDQSNTR